MSEAKEKSNVVNLDSHRFVRLLEEHKKINQLMIEGRFEEAAKLLEKYKK